MVKGVLALTVALAFSLTSAASAQEKFGDKRVYHTLKSDVFSIPDKEGHVLVVSETHGYDLNDGRTAIIPAELAPARRGCALPCARTRWPSATSLRAASPSLRPSSRRWASRDERCSGTLPLRGAHRAESRLGSGHFADIRCPAISDDDIDQRQSPITPFRICSRSPRNLTAVPEE